jgi:hypothetical protein
MKLAALPNHVSTPIIFKVLQQYELRMAGPPWNKYHTATFTA